MNEDRYAARAARLLREARRRITPQRASSPDSAIAALGQTISRAARRRRQRGLLVATASVALCAAAVLLVLRGRPSAPTTVATTTEPAAVRQSGKEAPADARAEGRVFVAGGAVGAIVSRAGAAPRSLAVGQPWRSGERLRTAAEPLELSTSDGSSIRAGAASDLELLRADEQRWFRLATGKVWVHVASKLKGGERFVVVTPDAEVEVRGTRFEVDVVPAAHDCGGGTVTRVKVQEGIVQVRGPDGDARVPAGDSWPAGCVESPVAAAPRPAGPRLRALAPRTTTVAASPDPSPASTLATENDLFSSALRAERQGNPRAAIELLDLLLRRFPRSPLGASATAARDRLSASAPAR